MRSVRQLLRQPAKLVFGIVLIAIAASVLVVCLGQSIAAGRTEQQLEYDFTTIARASVFFSEPNQSPSPTRTPCFSLSMGGMAYGFCRH